MQKRKEMQAGANFAYVQLRLWFEILRESFLTEPFDDVARLRSGSELAQITRFLEAFAKEGYKPSREFAMELDAFLDGYELDGHEGIAALQKIWNLYLKDGSIECQQRTVAEMLEEFKSDSKPS